MAQPHDCMDEIRQSLATLNSQMGQLNDRVHHLESRPQSNRSHNNNRCEASDRDDYDSQAEGQYNFRDQNSRQNTERLGGNLKLSPPTFSGKVDPEEFLNWERRMNNLFDNFDYSGAKKVAIATAQFTDHALSWWDREVTTARRRGERQITSWIQLTEKMRARYVPNYFLREIQNRFRRLSQGSRSVEEYYQEFEHLRNRLNSDESEESLMAQFLDGLQDRIAHKVERLSYNKLEDLLHLACQVEQQIKKKASSSSRNKAHYEPSKIVRNEPPIRPTNRTETSAQPKNIADPAANKTITITGGQREQRRPPSTENMVCYKCQGRGHLYRDCPNKRTMILTPDGNFVEEQEEEGDTPAPENNEEELTTAEFPEAYTHSLVNRRILSSIIGADPELQRENLFYTTCAVKTRICSLIIDGGSCTNVASKRMVDRLGLTTTLHPQPYQLKWLNDKEELKVKDQVQVPIKIGNYLDTITCDVIPMQAGHILLGRPWQFDKSAVHDGRTNQYVIMHGGKKFRLAPLTPEQVRKLHQASPPPKQTVSLFMSSKAKMEQAIRDHEPIILKYLRREHLFPNLQKNVFGINEINFFGFVIGKNREKVAHFKDTTLQEWPKPTVVTQVRSPHDLTSSHRGFVAEFSSIAAPAAFFKSAQIQWGVIWVQLQPKHFPLWEGNSKLSFRGDIPFRILPTINDNDSKLGFPGNYRISPAFNVTDLPLVKHNRGNKEEEDLEPLWESGNDEVITSVPVDGTQVRVTPPVTRTQTRESRIQNKILSPDQSYSLLALSILCNDIDYGGQ